LLTQFHVPLLTLLVPVQLIAWKDFSEICYVCSGMLNPVHAFFCFGII